MAKHESLFTPVFENSAMIVVNKASGLSVTPDRFDSRKKSLVSLLSEFLGRRLFIVHRIDAETSGLVAFAKDAETHRRLQQAFEGREVEKTYLAVVHGRPAWEETECSLPLVPDGNKRHQTIVDKYRGKPSFTRFRLLFTAGQYAAVEASPSTGRTHQIRVHLSSLGHPIVCDSLYGPPGRPRQGVFLSSFKPAWRGERYDERPLISRLALHAGRLTLPPSFAVPPLEAPLPRDISALCAQMRKNGIAPP